MKKKVYLMFPGQGSQYVGMGKSIEPALLDSIDKKLNYSLSNLMLNGPDEKLALTENTQPAILAHSLSIFYKLKPLLTELDIEIAGVLGHSVGEYAALVAVEVLALDDAIQAVHLRGKYMQEATPLGTGAMVAILKVPAETLSIACKEVSRPGSYVSMANFNEPTQIVVSGAKEACDRLVEWLAQNYKEPHRAVVLNVSAPFHSELMKPAADSLMKYFRQIPWHKNQLPYIANIDAKLYSTNTDPAVIIENLYRQAFGSVLWYQSIQTLPEDAVLLEVGPSKVLTALARKINRQFKVLALDSEFTKDSIAQLFS